MLHQPTYLDNGHAHALLKQINNSPATYFRRNSDRNRYPWQERKSSSNNWLTSLESFRKQNTATNISTTCKINQYLSTQFLHKHWNMLCNFDPYRQITSKGVNSGILCMFSMQSATHPLSEIEQQLIRNYYLRFDLFSN